MTLEEQRSVPTLLEVFDGTILPLLEDSAPLRCVVANPTLEGLLKNNDPLPPGVVCTPRPLRSQGVRQRRNTLTMEPFVARWPADRLIATRAPIVLCAVAGDVDFHLGNYNLHLPQGNFCLLPSAVPRCDGSVPHLEGKRLAKGSCDLLWIKGSESDIQVWICHSRGEEHWIGDVTSRLVIPNREAALYFTTMVQSAQSKTKEGRIIRDSLLKVVCSLVLRDLRDSRFHRTMPESPRPRDGNWAPIAYAKDYIRQHIAQRLTIEQVARAVYLSHTGFTDRFRSETGQTFHQFLTECRLETAQRLLRDTDFWIESVAEQVGLQSSQLRRLFIAHLGVSPQEYRRSQTQRGADETASQK